MHLSKPYRRFKIENNPTTDNEAGGGSGVAALTIHIQHLRTRGLKIGIDILTQQCNNLLRY